MDFEKIFFIFFDRWETLGRSIFGWHNPEGAWDAEGNRLPGVFASIHHVTSEFLYNLLVAPPMGFKASIFNPIFLRGDYGRCEELFRAIGIDKPLFNR